MIKKGGKKTNDIYMEVGFKNRSHFSTAYKKQFGHSPALS
ncbi:MAG: helix-turn-helix transcriptional regulator [Muribaculaceae bacterium]|nr:helix-turn-helix transcriptional regulator [Muribaculaceae bacterium]